jgi:tetratricopeptide (TPR) repeat protein
VPFCRARVSAILIAAVATGCVSAPRPLDVAGMVKTKGAVIARQDLEIRVQSSPRDVQLHLALARLAADAKRPAQALAELEAVIRIGGPLGTRWHDDDRATFARLLAARGRARLARGASSALEDLTRAKDHGAAIDSREIERARAAVAIAQLRHVDAKERAKGQATLAGLAGAPFADPSWIGAKPQPVPRDRGEFGVWLWQRGARRAAYEALRDWFATTGAKGGPLHDAYLRALAWWTPIDLPPPPSGDLVGAERCRFAGAPSCAPQDVLDDPAAAAALLTAPVAASTDGDAGAWLALTLVPALRGEAGWGEALARRLDLATVGSPAPYARAAAARLHGKRDAGVGDAALAELRPSQRLVVAAGRVLDGDSAVRVRAALGALEGSPEGVALLRIIDPARPAPFVDPLAAALGAYLRVRHLDGLPVAALLAAYRKNPTRADTLAADAVAEAVDAAQVQAALGALFDVLGDPARSRAAYQAAVDASPEPAFIAGLAEAMARANDPDAAMIQATSAAAASGDPAVVWASLARALDDLGRHVHALEAARSAIDLAGPEMIGPALDVAITASRALRRDAQVAALIERRRVVAAPVRIDRGIDDPTDATAAIAAAVRLPAALAIARMWIASRWNPRDVAIRAALLAAIAPDDPRRTTLVTELVALAGDRDPDVGREAIRSLAR